MDPASALLSLCLTLQPGALAEHAEVPAKVEQTQSTPSSACKQIAVRTSDGVKRVSFGVQDANLRELLLCLAKVGGVSIIMDPEVEGKVTAELFDVPWDQALRTILRTHGLAGEIDGQLWTPTSRPPADDPRGEHPGGKSPPAEDGER